MSSGLSIYQDSEDRCDTSSKRISSLSIKLIYYLITRSAITFLFFEIFFIMPFINEISLTFFLSAELYLNQFIAT